MSITNPSLLSSTSNALVVVRHHECREKNGAFTKDRKCELEVQEKEHVFLLFVAKQIVNWWGIMLLPVMMSLSYNTVKVKYM